MPRNWDVNELAIVVPLCISVDEVLRTLELPKSGGNRQTVIKWIKHLGIDTSHFLGQGHRKGSTDAVRPRQSLESILVENSSYTNSHRLKLRLILENVIEHKCYMCNLTTWLDKPIPLELHHINGVRNDHRLSNLEVLCPNCHALTDNYRAKNIAGLA